MLGSTSSVASCSTASVQEDQQCLPEHTNEGQPRQGMAGHDGKDQNGIHDNDGLDGNGQGGEEHGDTSDGHTGHGKHREYGKHKHHHTKDDGNHHTKADHGNLLDTPYDMAKSQDNINEDTKKKKCKKCAFKLLQKKHHDSSETHGTKTPAKLSSTPKMNKSRNEKFHKIFKDIPEGEVVIKSYSCAYFGDILIQGSLYITPNWFCFHSRILGIEKTIEIPVVTVLNISREKTAIIIPNAVGILTPQDKYVFGSLMSRDNTYKVLFSVWKQSQNAVPGEKEEMEMEENDIVAAGHDNNNISHTTFDDTESENSTPGLTPLNSPCSICKHDGDLGHITPEGESSGFPSPGTTSSQSVPAHHHSTSHLHARPSTITSTTRRARPPSSLPLNNSGSSQKSDTSEKSLANLFGKVKSIPRISLLLFLCIMLVLLLSVSAVILGYKILLLQAQLDGSLGWLDPQTSRFLYNQKIHSDLYRLNSRIHTATIHKFHTVLEANIQVLNDVHESLKSLQESPLLSHNACRLTSPDTEDDLDS